MCCGGVTTLLVVAVVGVCVADGVFSRPRVRRNFYKVIVVNFLNWNNAARASGQSDRLQWWNIDGRGSNPLNGNNSFDAFRTVGLFVVGLFCRAVIPAPKVEVFVVVIFTA